MMAPWVEVARLVLALLPRARTYPEDEREGRMPAEEVPLIGDELFAAVTEARVAFISATTTASRSPQKRSCSAMTSSPACSAVSTPTSKRR
jgi:hypothetical protein